VASVWVDDHCHLVDGPEGDRDIEAARAAGVAQLITVGTDLHTSRAAISVARRHEGVFATAGVHPHDASGGIDGIETLLADPEVVAVGECGLDFHYDHSPRPVQREVFAAQIRLALDHGMALVIHTREAWPETFEILDHEGTPTRTVFHCFTGGPDEASECVERGGYLSISGIVSFGSAQDVRDAVVATPLDRLLVETDSPYLAPVPHRGKRNEPAHVVRVGEVVAELKGITPAEVARATRTNAADVYRLPG
jgi:TatD DNase family protein